MKNLKLIGGLVIVLGGIIGLLYWDTWQTKKDDEQKAGEKKFVSFDKGRVNVIEYKSVDLDEEQNPTPGTEVAAVLKKNDEGNWDVTSPVAVKGDTSSINDFLSTIDNYKYDRIIESPENLNQYGLDKPHRSMTFKFHDEQVEPVTIFVGKKAPVGYSVYLKTSASDAVYIGSQYFLVSTAKTVRDFRDKKLVQIDGAALSRIEYKRRNSDWIHLVKEEGKYVITAPNRYAADQLSVDGFIRDLNDAIVEEFDDSPDLKVQTKLAQEAADVVLNWTDDKGVGKTLRFGKYNDDFLAAYDPAKVVFKLSSEFESKVTKTLLNFRDRRVFSFDSGDVSTAEIDGEVYVFKNEDWWRQEDAENTEGKTPQNFVRSLIVDLEFANANSFINLDSQTAQALVAPPTHTFKLGFSNDKPEMKIDVWVMDDQVFIKKTGGEFVYLVEKNTIEALNETAADGADDEPVETSKGELELQPAGEKEG